MTALTGVWAVRGTGPLGHPLVVVSLGMLIVNDQVLKSMVGGPVTGKLSDVAGLIVAPSLIVGVIGWVRGRAVSVWSTWLVALAVGLGFAGMQVSGAVDAWWAQSLGGAQWLLGGARGPAWSVASTMDVTDLWALPTVAVTPLVVAGGRQGPARLAVGVAPRSRRGWPLLVVAGLACLATQPADDGEARAPRQVTVVTGDTTIDVRATLVVDDGVEPQGALDSPRTEAGFRVGDAAVSVVADHDPIDVVVSLLAPDGGDERVAWRCSGQTCTADFAARFALPVGTDGPVAVTWWPGITALHDSLNSYQVDIEIQAESTAPASGSTAQAGNAVSVYTNQGESAWLLIRPGTGGAAVRVGEGEVRLPSGTTHAVERVDCDAPRCLTSVEVTFGDVTVIGVLAEVLWARVPVTGDQGDLPPFVHGQTATRTMTRTFADTTQVKLPEVPGAAQSVGVHLLRGETEGGIEWVGPDGQAGRLRVGEVVWLDMPGDGLVELHTVVPDELVDITVTSVATLVSGIPAGFHPEDLCTDAC